MRWCQRRRGKPRLYTKRSLHRHEFAVHLVEGVDAFFVLHAVAAAVIAAGVQILLHDFADADVFGLNLVAEGHSFAGGFAPQISLGQIPFKNCQRALGPQGQDDVERDVIGIAIEHPVGKDPEIIGGQVITGLLIPAWGGVSGLGAADRAPLTDILGIRLDGVGVVVDFTIERRVDTRQVVSLEIVVDVGLPVAVHFAGAALGELHTVEGELLRLGGQFAQRLAQRAGLGIEIHEDEVEPFFDANRDEAEVFGIKIFDAIEFGGDEQSAVEAVSPAVVGAAEEFAVSAAGGGVAGAMAADIIKAAENAVVAASDEERLSDEVEGKVVAGARDLVHVADDLPGGGEEPGLFVLKSCWVEIKGCGQSGSAGDVVIGIQLKVRHGRSGEAILAQWRSVRGALVLTAETGEARSRQFFSDLADCRALVITLVPIGSPASLRARLQRLVP